MRSGRRRLVGDGQSAAAKMLVDGDAPAVKGRRGVADELRWSKAELLVSLGGAEQHWGGGSTESRSSPEMKEGEAKQRRARHKWWGSTIEGLVCDRFEMRARAGGGREGAGRGAVVEAVRQLGYLRRGGLWRSKKGSGRMRRV